MGVEATAPLPPRPAAPSAPRWAVPLVPRRAPLPRPPAASAERGAAPSPEQAVWRPLASSAVLWRRRLSEALPGRPTQQCLAAAGRAAAQPARWRPREWAGPPWQREGPAVRPLELAPRGPACPRPRPSCDPVSWRAGVTAKDPPAAASTASPFREGVDGSLTLGPSRQMLKSAPCGAAQPLGRPPSAGRPPTRPFCRTPPPSPTPFGLSGTPWPKRRWAGSPRPWRGRLPVPPPPSPARSQPWRQAARPPSQPEPQVQLWRPRVGPQAQRRAGPYPPGVGSEQPLAPEPMGSPTRRWAARRGRERIGVSWAWARPSQRVASQSPELAWPRWPWTGSEAGRLAAWV
jgi:hypothetical protein